MTSEREFWIEVKKRRNHFFGMWFGWVPVGLICIVLYEIATGNEPPPYFRVGLLIVWAVLWWRVYNRLLRILCFRCGKPALAHALFFMRHARCQHCGLAYQDITQERRAG
jgi:hypothetical protein